MVTAATLPAMAVVIAVVAAVVFGLHLVSEHYAEPARLVTMDVTAIYDQDVRLVGGAWLDPAGKEIADPPAGTCPRGTDVGRSNRHEEAYEQCLMSKGYRHVVYFHPATRFWRFQWTEAAILLAGSLVPAGVAVQRTLSRRA